MQILSAESLSMTLQRQIPEALYTHPPISLTPSVLLLILDFLGQSSRMEDRVDLTHLRFGSHFRSDGDNLDTAVYDVSPAGTLDAPAWSCCPLQGLISLLAFFGRTLANALDFETVIAQGTN
ncbi:hypothetical protein Hypma_001977 [Hypsizygus marmoreus]|uniref:Uncharacterized protein n=1 Tax=Hypsizygus marmoreus TaxID=39966 RepID=A0A369J9F9_HYPMA|nr:hypothetical protein Hypma_001977 [Hypsizygus marmoreus]